PTIDAEALYEVVDGRRVELPPMGAYSNWIATQLTLQLGTFIRDGDLGLIVAETLFLLDARRDLKRRPDIAFVSYERWPKGRPVPEVEAWDVIPNLVVEVLSPTDRHREVIAKVHEYFQYGVERVWNVLPDRQQVYA